MAFHSGIGRYIRNHLAVLRNYDYDVIVAVEKQQHIRWLQRYIDGRTDHLKFVVHSISPHGVTQFVRLPRRLLKCEPDIFWFPHLLVAPYALPQNSVVTVHDLIPLHGARGARDRIKRVLTRRALEVVVARAARVVCGSQWVADELVKIYPEVEPRVAVTGNGVLCESWLALSDEQRLSVRENFGFGRYLLAVGIEEGRKNHGLLLRILERLPESLADVRIVLVGERARRRKKTSEVRWREEVDRWARVNPSLANRFVELGEVNELQLWKLYAAAEAFLFPSLDEGFGLPILEAMACGTCVITSDRTPVSLVAGPHSLLADPERVESWVEKIAWLLERPAELRRRREAGLAYVREKWRWQKSTEELVAVFESVVAKTNRQKRSVNDAATVDTAVS